MSRFMDEAEGRGSEMPFIIIKLVNPTVVFLCALGLNPCTILLLIVEQERQVVY